MEPFLKKCLRKAKIGIFEALPVVVKSGHISTNAAIPFGMKKLILYTLLFLMLLPSCSGRTSNNTIRVVKPKYHHRFFSRKNDKKAKRVKMVKVRN